MVKVSCYGTHIESALSRVGSSRSPGAYRRLRLWLPAVLLVSACATSVPPFEGDRSGDTDATTSSAKKQASDGAPGARVEAPQGEMPVLDRENSVYFALASTDIDDAGRQVLRRHAAKLQADPRLTVTLSGYTDDLGSREYNVALGQKRADAVEQELRALRVSAKQIRKRTYGNEKAHPQRCVSEACRQSLRRVELNYLD